MVAAMSQRVRKVVIVVIFFFKAEEGIRYSSVTGVQTCALPICLTCGRPAWPARPRPRRPAAGQARPAAGSGGRKRERAAWGKSVGFGGGRIITKNKVECVDPDDLRASSSEHGSGVCGCRSIELA